MATADECEHEHLIVDDDGLDRRWYHCTDCDRAVVPDDEPDAQGWSVADEPVITESEQRVLDGNR